MKSSIGHIQFNIHPQNIQFYKDLLTFLGWSVCYEDESFLGFEGESGTSLWFGSPAKEVQNDYDGPGMNHLGLLVGCLAEVDQVVDYLQEHNIQSLFGTPCHRPEFAISPDHTYYQVMFESPDRILWEVVYIGLKDK